MSNFFIRPCLDSEEHGSYCRDMLMISRYRATELGISAVKASEDGVYYTDNGHAVDWKNLVDTAVTRKLSIPPDQILPASERRPTDTQVQIVNQTALEAARRLVDQGLNVLALNLANGVNPGGGFLHGARA